MKKLMVAAVAAVLTAVGLAGSAEAALAVPVGYTPIDYVKFTGAQYVMVGVDGLDVSAAELNHTDSLDQQYYAGNFLSAIPQTGKAMPIFNPNSMGVYLYFRGENGGTKYGRTAPEILFVGSGEARQNGTVMRSGLDSTLPLVAASGEIRLGDVSIYMKDFAVYRLRLWGQNGALLRDLVPCIEDATGTAGLYDLADHSDEVGYDPFYPSSTETALVAGPKISQFLIPYIPAQTYSGEKAYEPEVSLLVRGSDDETKGGTVYDTVVPVSQYDVTYENNTQPGIATAILTGKDALDGFVIRKHFMILGEESPFDKASAQSRAALPAGYTPIEYVQCTGSQYVMLGVDGLDVYGADLNHTDNGGQIYGGNFLSAVPKKGNAIGIFTPNSGNVYLYFRGTGDKYARTKPETLSVKDGCSRQNGTVCASGLDKKVPIVSASGEVRVGDTGLADFRIYNLRLWGKDGFLLRDMVPCIQDETGTVGLYDLANHTDEDDYNPFYPSSTETALVAGPPVSQFRIPDIPAQAYAGEKAYEPEVTLLARGSDGVTSSGTSYEIPVDTDNYDVTYENNTKPGIATAVLVGKNSLAGMVLRRRFLIQASASPFEVVGSDGMRTPYARLEDAVAACGSSATIELVADADYDTAFSLQGKTILIRSCTDPSRNPSGRRYTLRRTAPVSITLTAMKNVTAGKIVLENLVWDGGADWCDATDVVDFTTLDSLTPCDLFLLNGYQYSFVHSQQYFGTLALGAGGVIRNVRANLAMVNGQAGKGGSYEGHCGGFVMEEGSLIADCRSLTASVYLGKSRGQTDLAGGSITRCFCGAGKGIVTIENLSGDTSFGTTFKNAISGVAITNNVVAENAALLLNGPLDVKVEFSGSPVVRDNTLADGVTPANAIIGSTDCWLVGESMSVRADIRCRVLADGADTGLGDVICGHAVAQLEDAHEAVFQNELNPLLRAKIGASGELVWGNRLMLDRPITLSGPLDATGVDLDLVAGANTPDSGAVLIDSPAGVTGRFNFTPSSTRGDPARHWTLGYPSDGKSVTAQFLPPGLILLVR